MVFGRAEKCSGRCIWYAMCIAGLAAVLGCSFDTTGGAGTADATSGTEGDTGESTTSDINPSTTRAPSASTTNATSGSTTDDPGTTEPTSMGPTTDVSETDTPTEDSSSSSSSSSSGGDDDPTTADPCANGPLIEDVFLASELPANAINQMTERTSALLPGNASFWYSLEEGVGDITFTFDVICQTEVHLWALTYDFTDAENNADSLYYAIDGNAEVGGEYWLYTCEPQGAIGWQWRRLRRLVSNTCNEEVVTATLDPGPHTLNLRNRERGDLDKGGATFDFAGIAGIAVGSSAAYDPNDDYPLQ